MQSQRRFPNAFPIILLLILIGGGVSSCFQTDSDAASIKKGMDAYIKGDFSTALKEWKPLAESGNAAAQHNLGIMYVHGTAVTQDYKAALKWIRLAADQGNADAQNTLGVMYENGYGVTVDGDAALKWYTLAAENGDANAQYSLGVMSNSAVHVLEP